MAIFTSIGVATALGIGASFFTGAIAFGLNAAVAIGISLAARALGDKPVKAQADHFSAQGTLQTGGDVPRSFQLGYSVTAGSLVYANEWGQSGETPNAYHTQVIALQDLPGGNLVEVWVNGELCTLGDVVDADLGAPVLEYRKDGGFVGGARDHLWIKFYDGTQTAADPLLTGQVSSAERPYGSDRVGYGVAYVICTALVEDTLFTGFPTYKFALSGIPLYDISKDSTAGGSGSHRWSDKSTWGGDGDNLPAVQVYNLLRGITYNGTWLYGLQNMAGARLPAANWIAQIAKCRATIMGEDGPEPTYRSGGQINVDAQIANAVEALLTACQGRLSEIGGFYKLHLGAPDSPSFSFTDDDILSTEEQSYRPFFALADSVNGIAAKYPLPAEGWNTKVAPPIYRSDLEAKDGGRRLLANPSFDFVPYSAQVQRLMSSALEEAQRARTHSIVMPPAYWPAEPGDVCEWTSARNGYEAKLFRVDAASDRANLDIGLALSEVDPSDYDWDHDVDFEPVPIAPTTFERPAPQQIEGWDAEPATIEDNDGIGRRPAIRLLWNGDMPGVAAVQYEVRLASSLVVVARGRTDRVEEGELLVSQALLPATEYEARGAYIPSSPRDVEWSEWISVTTRDVRLSEKELTDAIRYQVTEAFSEARNRVAELEDIVDTLGNELAAAFLQRKSIKGEVGNARDYAKGITYDLRTTLTETIELNKGEAEASIEEVRDIAVATDAAFSAYTTTTTATLGSLQSQITVDAANLVTTNNSIATLSTSVTAQFGTVNSAITSEAGTRAAADTTISSSVTSEATARATADTAINSSITSLTSTVASNTAAISSEAATRASADSAIVSTANSLATTVAGNTSAISSEASARASADTAINGTLTSLTSTVSGNTSAISSEAATRASADTTLAGQISSLTTTVSGNTAAISSESAARSSADAALATQIATLSTSVSTGVNHQPNPRFLSAFANWTPNDAFWSISDTASGTKLAYYYNPVTSAISTRLYGTKYAYGAGYAIGISGIRWINDAVSSGQIYVGVACYDASNNFIAWRQLTYFYDGGLPAGQSFYTQNFVGPAGQTTPAGTAFVQFVLAMDNVASSSGLRAGLQQVMISDDPTRVFSDDGSIVTNTAGITTEAATRASADSALSSSLTTLSTTVGGHTSSISQMLGSKDGVGVYYSLIATLDGVTGGLVFYGAQVNGGVVYNWKMSGNVVLDGTMTASKIATGALTSDSGVFGALSVKTFSIADQAVTVCEATSDPGPSVRNTSNVQWCLLTATIDTTGLIGKTLKLFVSGRYVVETFGGTGLTLKFQSNKDSAGWVDISTPYSSANTGQYREPIAHVYSFTVSASSHTVQFRFLINSGNDSIAKDMVLACIVCKR